MIEMMLADYVHHALKTWVEKVWWQVEHTDDDERELVEQALITIVFAPDQAAASETTTRQLITIVGINACRVQLRDHDGMLHIAARAGSLTGIYSAMPVDVAGQDLGLLEVWSEPERDVHLLTVEQLSRSVARQLGWVLLGMRQMQTHSPNSLSVPGRGCKESFP